MVIWIYLLIPVLSIAFLVYRYKFKCTILEIFIPVVATVVTILICRMIYEYSVTSSNEYLGGYITQVKYFERWNERVSCRHPIYCRSCSGSGNSRSCYSYVCGHHHPYDVDDHPERWVAETNIDYNFEVNNKTFEFLSKLWGNKTFVDMYRNYHTIDGDMYKSEFDGLDDHLQSVVKEHSYINKVASSSSVYSFEEVNDDDKKLYEVYDYPPVKNNKQISILGEQDDIAEWQMQVLNSRLGSKKQVKFFILVFHNKSITSSIKQEAYWKGGNKNELVLSIGVDNDKKVMWSRAFSWSDSDNTKQYLENIVLDQMNKRLNLTDIVDRSYNVIDKTFIRKEFSDFEYLEIKLSVTYLVVTFLIVLAVNIIACVFVVKNTIIY